MGRIVDMRLPRLGETMEEGKIVAWAKQPGDRVRRGETLLEVETDKTVVECPALVDGILRETLVNPDDRVPVDEPIARIELAANAATPEDRTPPAEPAKSVPTPLRAASKEVATGARARASGKARSLARKLGVDLARLEGTGRGGRISGGDVMAATSHNKAAQAVLIHGLFADAASYSLMKRSLKYAGIDAIAFDLPGHGGSEQQAGKLEAMVMAAEASLPEGRFVLVGHSLGAAIAASLARRNEARIKHLVLIAPLGFGPEINTGFIEATLKAETEDALREALQVLGPTRTSQAFLVKQLARIRQNRAPLKELAASVAENGFQKISLLPDLARLAVPVTAIFGRDDPIIPLHHALSAPPNVEVRIISGGGHVPHWFQADIIAGLIRT
jgi:pyruvate dehydrogenase E2 component (dihydrolipoamide acetyltransferase)